MPKSDLAKFEKLPVLFQWRWSQSEWTTIVRSLEIRFPWGRALGLSFGVPAAFMVLSVVVNRNRHPPPTLFEAGLILLLFASLFMLAAAVLYWARKYGHLLPRFGDEPVCVITPEGIRLGDRVLWFRYRKSSFVKVAAIPNPLLGMTVVITVRYHTQGDNIDMPIVLPVPRAKPQLADEVARSLTVQLGLNR